MAKAISQDDEENNIFFFGAGKPKETGAQGVHNAILAACSATLGENIEGEVFRRASSFVNNGASLNTGEKNGLWALIDRDFYLPLGDEPPTPMIKIWCDSRLSKLGWKSVTNSIKSSNSATFKHIQVFPCIWHPDT